MNARDWAQQLIDGIEPAIQSRLAANPLQSLVADFKLAVSEVTERPARGTGGACDGISILQDRLVLYVGTPGSRRYRFTLLHELGHYLILMCDDLLDWLGEKEEAERRRLEEEVCDALAASLLVPDNLLDAVLAGDPVSARHVRALFDASRASREVCAIALARRLGCEGFVVLADFDPRKVRFSSRTAETCPYPWRGDPIAVGHALRQLGRDSKLQKESWWPYLDATHRQFWLDACSDNGCIYAVFADTDLWGISRVHLFEPVEERPKAHRFSVNCQCGFVGSTTEFPCDVCHQPFCPKCHACSCTWQARSSGVCRHCRTQVPLRRLMDGVCNDCRAMGRK